VESQQPAVRRQRPVNSDKGMVFSVQSVPMAAHTTTKYVMPSLRNNCTSMEQRCFLRGPFQDVIRKTSNVLQLLRFSRCNVLLFEAGS
jgi:hypothetical protein